MEKMNMKYISRRKAIKSAAIGAGAALISAPAIAKNILKWEPEISLSEGMGKEYHWATTHLDRWERIQSTKW